jgi:oxygen-independent coproporphyrinogen-3 oxidase
MADIPKASLPKNSGKQEAAIYVHWPFCAKKCPYCDFNSHVRDQVDQNNWKAAMLQEIETFAAHYPNLKAKSIFFGGGTPSLMPPDTTHAIINAIHKNWAPTGAIETTLEANPSSVEAARFQDYKEAGVNRISIGIQSLNDTSLKFLGRLHNASEALKALKVARDTFERVSFDLIYALPEQSLEDWRAELLQALSFSPSHLSLYQLTIEEGTAFYHQFHRGKFSLPDEDEALALFELTQSMTETAGLPAYETSNHAKPGQESAHNLAYWQGNAYVGIGPGAHGRLPGISFGSAVAHHQIKRPEDWLKAVNKHGIGLEALENITKDERAVETIMMGLRLRSGISSNQFSKQFGASLLDYLDTDTLSELEKDGFLISSESALSLTPKGAPLLNFLLPKLIA